eukprot:CAMPEP_0195634292 /NCGR_PEP_ID=MMETSP0815-20121206/22620_1 /TAXON_ID=97485 /ORGANISM="Prymnesium parvum, Strain Texoma1" /LENGTH=50 /DNA_ID=CAMNT_0040776049 /DNA_START=259 /DNA_END=408 /DNA_ORIENTATION=+
MRELHAQRGFASSHRSESCRVPDEARDWHLSGEQMALVSAARRGLTQLHD